MRHLQHNTDRFSGAYNIIKSWKHLQHNIVSLRTLYQILLYINTHRLSPFVYVDKLTESCCIDHVGLLSSTLVPGQRETTQVTVSCRTVSPVRVSTETLKLGLEPGVVISFVKTMVDTHWGPHPYWGVGERFIGQVPVLWIVSVTAHPDTWVSPCMRLIKILG